MMTMAHAAAGAAIAQAVPSRRLGTASAFAAHALLDLPRHEDLGWRGEGVLTLTTLAAMIGIFGLRSREFWGGFACAAPDLEHLARRPRGLYPTHRWGRLHNMIATPRLNAPTQVALAGLTIALIAQRARRER